MPFCTEASTFTNIYAAAEGKGGWYGHKWESVNEAELLWWHVMVAAVLPIRYGARMGDSGAAFISGGCKVRKR